MKHIRKTGWVAVVIALAAAGSQVPRFLHADTPANRAAVPGQMSLADLAVAAIDADPAISKPAIDRLRAAGPAGLEALMTANKTQIDIHRSGATVFGVGKADDIWPRITAALDAVAAQHDAYAAGLYWYTDMEAAQAAAKSSGKPILSLRLLGNLNDEYSCANSRFFRTVLYANADVSKHLRENFILHWQSVRPVPVITIDFGDGRKIRRTITGNSIHYVLTADGKVVDAIPGLYGPKAFLRELGEAEKEFGSVAAQPGVSNQPETIRQWHADQATKISASFDRDFGSLSLNTAVDLDSIPAPRIPRFFISASNPWEAAERLSTVDMVHRPFDPDREPGYGFRADGYSRLPDVSGRSGSFWVDPLSELSTPLIAGPVIAPPSSTWGADERLATINISHNPPSPLALGVLPPSGLPEIGTDLLITDFEIPNNPPTALGAIPITASKGLVESPMVRALEARKPADTPSRATTHSGSATPSALSDADWSRLAALHAEDAALDQSSHALMEAKTIDAVTAARRAMSKRMVEDPLVKTVANFQRSIAEDTVRNEYLYHLQIHRWLADPANANLTGDVNALNKRVYAELFLTPDSDPWLGLVPADTYTALDDGGVCH